MLEGSRDFSSITPYDADMTMISYQWTDNIIISQLPKCDVLNTLGSSSGFVGKVEISQWRLVFRSLVETFAAAAATTPVRPVPL